MRVKKIGLSHIRLCMSIVFMMLLSLAVSSMAATTSEAPKPKYGGVLKIGFIQVPRVLGYPGGNQPYDTYSMWPCVENIVRLGKDLQPEPMLAESWDIGPDGKFLTFKLRKGVKFHDGTDFNADAVKANMDIQMAAKRSPVANITSIDVVDPYTVRFNLKQWDIALFYNLAQDVGVILSPASLKKGADAVKFTPVGTGPFKFVSYEPDVRLKYAKFDGYWQKGKPYLDGLEIIYITNTLTMVNALKVGEVDLLRGISSGREANDLESSSKIKIMSIPSISYALNPDSRNPDSPLANKKVREAVEYGLDRVAIAKALGFGYWVPLFENVVESHYAYVPGLKREYNPDQAKKLLAEAGYGSGFNYKIYAVASTNKDAMVAIQSQLSKIGINISIEIVDTGLFDEYRKQGWKGGFLMTGFATLVGHILASSQINLPINYAVNYSTERPAGYADILSKGLSSSDFNSLKANSQALVKALYDEVTIIPVYGTTSFAPKYSYVQDDGNCLKGTLMWEPENAWLNK